MDDERDDDDWWVRASEIAEYTYCARAYWLNRVVHRGVPVDAQHAARLAAGVSAHHAYGQELLGRRRAPRMRIVMVVVAMVLLALAVILLLARR